MDDPARMDLTCQGHMDYVRRSDEMMKTATHRLKKETSIRISGEDDSKYRGKLEVERIVVNIV